LSKARALMIQGTGSGVGKSFIAAGILRIMSDMGIKCAPFKAQNMALNSFITIDGGEIGRAQALQAECARVPAMTEMNPILLKATGEAGSQVIINGRAFRNMPAREYYAFKETAWEHVRAAYERLGKEYELIVLEGAGSPAEINLMESDIVNMRMARHAEAAVLLVGDIDRGGVFASLFGTINLIEKDKALIKGFIINKFRGDADILAPGLKMLEEKTGVRPLGVLPYFRACLSEEDGLSLDENYSRGEGAIKIVVIRNGFISNFTDFEAFSQEPDIELIYSTRSSDVEGADLVILPGTKNTVKDLLLLRSSGAEASIKHALGKGIPVIGICGGYQMMGTVIKDPYKMESDMEEVKGMGLLDIETVLQKEKITSQVEGAERAAPEEKLKGYEIHMGISRGDIGLFDIKRLATGERVSDGSRKGNAWGTYIHGIFDNDRLRGRLLNSLRQKRGIPEKEPVNYAGIKEEAINRLASIIRENLDMKYIEGLCLR
jgi:adenosylcobyric acid synthase